MPDSRVQCRPGVCDLSLGPSGSTSKRWQHKDWVKPYHPAIRGSAARITLAKRVAFGVHRPSGLDGVANSSAGTWRARQPRDSRPLFPIC